MCILPLSRNCNGQNFPGFLYFCWTLCYFHEVKAKEVTNHDFCSFDMQYYSMLWRIQPIAGLEMVVSYAWVFSVLVCALLEFTCI